MKKVFIWPAMKNMLFSLPIFLLDNIYIRFGSKLYGQNVWIHMGTYCAALLLICFCSAIRGSFTKEKRYDLIDYFNSTSRYQDDLLYIDNILFFYGS